MSLSEEELRGVGRMQVIKNQKTKEDLMRPPGVCGDEGRECGALIVCVMSLGGW